MPTTAEKLARITRYATKYEVIAEHPEYRSILLGYTGRKSFQGLLVAARQHGEQLVDLLGLTTDHRADRQGSTLLLGNGWSIRFSGRTQREAYTEGERPFVANMDNLEPVA